jgi:hypothetical protein
MAKIIYFIAGNAPTVGEAADIAKLEAATGAPYELAIRSNKAIPEYGEGRYEVADFVAGTLPGAAESDVNDFYAAIDEIDPDNIPVTNVPSTSVVVSDGDELAAVGGGTIAVAVAAGVATYTYTAP